MAKKESDIMKKAYILYVLDAVKEKSWKGNPVTQSDIIRIINKKYGVELDRKAVKNNIEDLIALNYPIVEVFEDSEGNMVIRNGKPLCQGYYYDWDEQDITDSQLFLMMDFILCSPYLNKDEANDTLNWIVKQAPPNFREKYKSIKSSTYDLNKGDRNVLYNIQEIDWAAREDKKMYITYNEFDKNGKLVAKQNHTNVMINPYYTVMENGHYYLICNRAGEEGFYHYRVDKITNPSIIDDSKRRPITDVDKNFELPKYIKEHPYVFAGDVERVNFIIKKSALNGVYDFFGKGAFNFVNNNELDDEHYEITMRTNINGFYYWALQYGESIEVKTPQSLRDRIRNTVTKMSNTYSVGNDDRYNIAVSECEDERGNFRNFMNLAGIDLRGKQDHKDMSNLKVLTVGRNNIGDYNFINNYQNLRRLILEDLKCTENLNLELPSLLSIEVGDFIGRIRYPDGEIPSIPNLDFIRNCNNLLRIELYLDVEDLSVLYTFKNLECIYASPSLIEKIELERFGTEAKLSPKRKGVITFPANIERGKAERKREFQEHKREMQEQKNNA